MLDEFYRLTNEHRLHIQVIWSEKCYGKRNDRSFVIELVHCHTFFLKHLRFTWFTPADNTHRLTLNNCCNVFSQARARDPHWKAASMRCSLVKPIQHFYRYRYIRFKDLQFLFSRNVSLDYFKRCPPNWPFLNYLWPLFQSESWCYSFHMKTSFHLHVNES